jgi:hypothetical protein
MEKKNKFNESLGVSYPYFSFLFLFDEYVKKMSAIQSLDFNLLLENVKGEDQEVSAELSVNRLEPKEKVELCKLMSRSAGKFNIYKGVGFGNDLRNPSLNLNQSLHIRADFGSESDEIEYVMSLISSLTLAKAFAAYSYFKSRLSSPFRMIQVYWDGNFFFLSLGFFCKLQHLICFKRSEKLRCSESDFRKRHVDRK